MLLSKDDLQSWSYTDYALGLFSLSEMNYALGKLQFNTIVHFNLVPSNSLVISVFTETEFFSETSLSAHRYQYFWSMFQKKIAIFCLFLKKEFAKS